MIYTLAIQKGGKSVTSTGQADQERGDCYSWWVVSRICRMLNNLYYKLWE